MRLITCIALMLGALAAVAGCSGDVPGVGQSVDTLPVGHLPPPTNLKWSPKGDWIVFLEAGRMQMVNAEDMTQREVLSGQGGYANPVWSPDGERIAYDHAPDMLATDIWISQPFAGRTPIGVTENIRADELPCWSPDGKWVAFQTFRKGNWDIWKVDANGYRDPVPITSDPSNEKIPAWSPDGAQIAFASNRTGVETLWVQPVDGDDSTAWQLTDNAERDTAPVWSPDGTQIAYLSRRSGQQYLWTVDAIPGGAARPVSVTSGVRAVNWSPDSQFLLFESNKAGWMVRADGQGQQVQVVGGLEPIWHPKGGKIAYVRWDETRYRITIKEQTTDLW